MLFKRVCVRKYFPKSRRLFFSLPMFSFVLLFFRFVNFHKGSTQLIKKSTFSACRFRSSSGNTIDGAVEEYHFHDNLCNGDPCTRRIRIFHNPEFCRELRDWCIYCHIYSVFSQLSAYPQLQRFVLCNDHSRKSLPLATNVFRCWICFFRADIFRHWQDNRHMVYNHQFSLYVHQLILISRPHPSHLASLGYGLFDAGSYIWLI